MEVKPSKELIFLSVAVILACGSGELSPKSPWKDSYARYFDDSVDFTINPQSLSGQWLHDYQEQLKSRITHSELILGVSIISVTKKTNPEGKECKDLYVEIRARVKGEYEKNNITFGVCDNQPGFDSFKEEDSRLYERAFIAFLKLYETESGEVGIHWHLSPLSKGLKEGMDTILKDRGKDKGEKKKYMHTHK